MKLSKNEALKRRHRRVRGKVSGTAERPRLYIRRSLRHLYAQLIDDSPETGSRTIVTFTTNKKGAEGHFRNIKSATALGKEIGAGLKERGVETIVFDRGGSRYHGIVKALADTVREEGITF